MLHRKIAVPCTGCRYCCGNCPQGLDIPSLLSAYNDYRDEAAALGNSDMAAWRLLRLKALPEENAYGLHWLRKLYGTLSTDIGYPYLYEGNGKSIEIAKPVSSQNQRRVGTALDSPVILCRWASRGEIRGGLLSHALAKVINLLLL